MLERPDDIATLLVSNIAESNRDWTQYLAEMKAALARHQALLHQCVEAEGGHRFSTGGVFCAAFATAPAALRAAIAVRRALHSEQWQTPVPPRTRLVLHSGPVELPNEAYTGPTLDRAARLLDICHGGQTLLAGVTQRLVRDTLPPDVHLRDLGPHRLNDLLPPEQIAQLVVPNLPADFPPLKTLDTLSTNLPVQPTALVGRESELASLAALLLQPAVRLVTLTGPGGTGKTRLALHAAARLLDRFADGVWFVNLAPVGNPTLVTPAIAQALAIVEAGGTPLPELLKSWLRPREALLLLDNFEHVQKAAPVLVELLATAPRLKLLVTSREPLHLSGEHEYAVSPLRLPDRWQQADVEQLAGSEAVRLFVARARAVKRDFALTSAAIRTVGEICARLDGLPLAIELAATRVKLLPPPALLVRLQQRLSVLTGGARDVPARQQTLRNTLDWSYNLLDAGEQQLFTRLAVFAGGGTLEAIDVVCNPTGEVGLDTLGGVASLLDKSLLRQEEGPDGEPRFVMLETIHEYAREKLEASGEARQLWHRYTDYFVTLIEWAEPELKGPGQVAWCERLEADHDNLRTALQMCLEHGHVDQAARLGAALWRFWVLHGHYSEGSRWLEAMLTHQDTLQELLRVRVLLGLATLKGFQGDYEAALPLNQATVAAARAIDDHSILALALSSYGWLLLSYGDHSEASGVAEEAAALARQQGDTWMTALALGNLGRIARARGDIKKAVSLHEECLQLWRQQGDSWGITLALINLGALALMVRDYPRAVFLYSSAVEQAYRLRDRASIAYCLEGFAGAAVGTGQLACAARLWAAAEQLRETIGTRLSPLAKSRVQPVLLYVRARLLGRWSHETREGRTMSLDEAITYGLETLSITEPGTSAQPVVLSALPAGLSEREAEVLRLVAQGFTNSQIAERLVLSPYTINAHLRTIYGKIGVNTRAVATRWATEHGLV